MTAATAALTATRAGDDFDPVDVLRNTAENKRQTLVAYLGDENNFYIHHAFNQHPLIKTQYDNLLTPLWNAYVQAMNIGPDYV